MSSKPLIDVSAWEALMHGVFAIALTLLVLDIPVPDAGSVESGGALLRALGAELPRYGAYVLAFIFLSGYWLATNRTLALVRGVDHLFLVSGLVLLMIIATVPFPTALLAEYAGLGSGRDQVALAVFVLWQLGLALLANVMVRYAAREHLLKPTVSRSDLRRWVRIATIGLVIWMLALVAALVLASGVTFALMAVIAVMFMLEVPIGDEPDAVTS